MTRRQVDVLLVTWLAVTWGAMALRCDRFPLTWAPMYSSWATHDVTSNRVVEKEVYMRGMLVTRRDGSQDHVGAEALNIARSHMYRLYYQRTFSKPPAKHEHGNEELGAFNRWIRGLEPGEDPFVNDMEFRVFQSLNKTFELDPGDPRFIVRVRASFDRLYRRYDDLARVWRETETADLRWHESWRERW